MPDELTAGQFHESDGVDDWRVVANGACSYFATGSFGAGAQLVEEIGRVAAAAGHAPDVDVRQSSVTVRLTSNEEGGFSPQDVDLARRISAAASGLGLSADPSAVQDVQVTIDALVGPDVRPFWRAVLNYREVGDEDIIDPNSRGPSIWFQEMDAPRPQRNRIHLDVFVPHDQAEARVSAGLAAGGRLVTDAHAPSWWVLADSEGNEACIATWVGRD